MQTKTRKIVMAAMLAALVCIATLIVKIPTPFKGYVNLGDGLVLLSGWMLGPAYGFAAAAIGSGLADLFAGYAIYAPATFLIKGLMAPLAFFLFMPLKKHVGSLGARIMGGICAEALMVLGYFAFEGVLYGFGAAALNLFANAMQGVAGILVGTLLAASLAARHLLPNHLR